MRALLSECVAIHLFRKKLRQPFPEEWGKILNSSELLGCDIIKFIYRWDPGRHVSSPPKLNDSVGGFHDHEDGSACRGVDKLGHQQAEG
jgi:hypothetical protein